MLLHFVSKHDMVLVSRGESFLVVREQGEKLQSGQQPLLQYLLRVSMFMFLDKRSCANQTLHFDLQFLHLQRG